MKILIFYHRGDLDGISSGAILFNKYETYDLKLVGLEYGDEIDEITLSKNYDLVYVVDFTLYPIEKMLKLNSENKLIWIDHHKSSLEVLKKYPELNKSILGDNTESAAHLVWKYLYPDEEVPYSIKLISLYDTWQHNFNNDILNFYTGLEIDCKYNPESDVWKKLLKNKEKTDFEESIIKKGKSIRDYLKMKNLLYAKEHAFETEFEGLKAIVINIGLSGANIFDSIYNPEKHDLMITFSRRANKIWKFSLYSDKENIDCSAICKKYGGGGHKGAAGFSIKDTELPFKIY